MSKRHKTIYKKKLSTDTPIAIFWMAIESLLEGEYTQKSDVYVVILLYVTVFIVLILPIINLEL